jgi:hypothetical protein
MTRDDIIKMAREAGFADGVAEIVGLEGFARFAALVAAAEREECARVLDEMADDMEREMEPSTAIAYVRSKAAAIRARGQQ